MKATVLFLVLGFPMLASAHDFWIEPSTFRPDAGSPVSFRFRVGSQYQGDPVPRKPDTDLIRFEAFHKGKRVPIPGVAGEDPAGTLTVAGDGLTVVAYQNKPAYVELDEETLRQYLHEEGLEKVHEVRAKSAFAGKPWREIYSRSAKSLLWTGRGARSGFDRQIGMPIELIPKKNPYRLKVGATLPLQLLYRGKPLAGTLVVAAPKAHPDKQIAIRSDARGRVRLKLHTAGEWMIKAVHIVPAPVGERGEWESFWASLTFELGR